MTTLSKTNQATKMKTKNTKSLKEVDLFNEDGTPKEILIQETDKFIKEKFGQIKILSMGPCVTDLIEGYND